MLAYVGNGGREIDSGDTGGDPDGCDGDEEEDEEDDTGVVSAVWYVGHARSARILEGTSNMVVVVSVFSSLIARGRDLDGKRFPGDWNPSWCMLLYVPRRKEFKLQTKVTFFVTGSGKSMVDFNLLTKGKERGPPRRGSGSCDALPMK